MQEFVPILKAGALEGMRFTCVEYYYSDFNGTIQLLTYTGERLLNKYYNEIELFLNGFVEC